MIFRLVFTNVEGFLKNQLTTPCVRAPTKAGTRNPGMVAAIFVIPISKPEQNQSYPVKMSKSNNMLPNLHNLVQCQYDLKILQKTWNHKSMLQQS